MDKNKIMRGSYLNKAMDAYLIYFQYAKVIPIHNE